MASQDKFTSRSPLLRLPCELKRYVMANLNITSLYALITTCKEFYDINKSSKGFILRAITTNALGDALPWAMALHAARRADWGTTLPRHSRGELLDQIHKFGRRYLNRNNKTLIYPEDFSFSLASELISFHSIVEKFSLKFMEETTSDMYFHYFRGHPIPKPTNTETGRVQLTFYCMEISRELLPFYVTQPDELEDNERPWQMLWHYFAPWENRIAEAISCLFLDKLIDNAVSRGLIMMGGSAYYEWYTVLGLRGFDKLADDEFVSRNAANIEAGQKFFRCVCYFALGESGFTWLRPVGGNLMVRSFNMDHLLARFPQEENGSCDNWYFTIISEQHNPQYAGFQPLPDETVWWDRARINAVFPGILPSIAEIQDMAEGNVYIQDFFEPEVDYCKEIGY
ncbi:hypothetical protein F4813DRAFT_397852 [Daldinia decipiens]|uniref:uncharacterized protein n=1 Tax=Daldinia decipiens TaxID=326647 RepID=UPI0020C312EF|nr:uncharacterized protein F4813DRAFT_397852 [Daldinia decipiens]KAI1655921.1 hypothetical protein F4813DRAFT_397852 [Daldinia decipiens]